MTFTVNRQSLAGELALLATTAEKKTTMPILSTVKVEFDGEVLRLTGTDIDMAIVTEIEASGEPWSGCIPAKQLNDLVRLFNGDTVEFTPKPNDRIQVKWGKSKHLLPIYPVSEFPVIDQPEVEMFVLDGTVLKSALVRALRCTSPDAVEHWMHGISLRTYDGVLTVTGTNSRNLGTTAIPVVLNIDILLPVRAALASVKFIEGEIRIGASDNRIVFHQERMIFTALLLDAKFPDWRPLVPSGFKHSIALDAESTSHAFRLAAVTAKESQLIPIPLKLTVSCNQLIVETGESEIGQSTEILTVDCPTLNGDALAARINGAHFISFLNAEEKPVVSFNDDLRMFQLSVEDDPSYRYITMTLRA